MSRTINTYLLAVIATLYTLPTLAEDAANVAAPTTLMEAITMGKPMTSFRLRYENVDQANKAEQANAWTMRSLIGWQTQPLNNFSITAQLINVTRFNDNFYDTTNTVFGGNTTTIYPSVVDPDYTGINQLFVDWTGIPDTKVRVGRQSVKLDNVRFIGNVEYRQIMQVFDGIAVENKSIKDLEFYAAHFEGLRRITSQYLNNGNVDIAHASWKYSPTESLTGYGYFQNMPHNGFTYPTTGTAFTNNSSQTFGLRADGNHKLDQDWKLLYTAEYAKQDAYQGGDSRIDAHYWRLGGGAGFGNWSARLDHELLSSNNGLYGFQTPLATGHLFQGLGDSFLTTPKHGIADTFITLNGKLLDIQLSAEYHWLNSDRDFSVLGGGTSSHYGKELDLVAGYNYDKNWSGKLEYFSFKEDAIYTTSLKPDSDKFMATLMYTF
ncbi:MAG: alginate export family protein [Methylophilales bacterium]|nr:alginate export family protein [Methylophilales bacterium]